MLAAAEELGWKPSVSFEEGLRRTGVLSFSIDAHAQHSECARLAVLWYRENPNHWPDITGALVAHPRMVMRSTR